MCFLKTTHIIEKDFITPMKILANYYTPVLGRNNTNFGMIHLSQPESAEKTENPLAPSYTFMFREYPVQSAAVKLLKKDRPTTFKVLGCSDGSEAWTYAILSGNAFKDKNLVRVEAVDKEESLIELAKTGYLICSDKEKELATNSSVKDIPLDEKSWGKIFKQTEEPPEFQGLVRRYPELADITSSKIFGDMSIGNGMEWQKINTERLPKVEFIAGDLRDYLESDTEQTVYVMANSVCYIGEKEGPDKFVEIFEKIQNENYNKKGPTYVVLGAVELDFISKEEPCVWKFIERLGFEHVSQYELMQAGVKNNEFMEDVKTKIFRLKPSTMPIKANFECRPGLGCPPYVRAQLIREARNKN